jgi:hypothetical protein
MKLRKTVALPEKFDPDDTVLMNPGSNAAACDG